MVATFMFSQKCSNIGVYCLQTALGWYLASGLHPNELKTLFTRSMDVMPQKTEDKLQVFFIYIGLLEKYSSVKT